MSNEFDIRDGRHRYEPCSCCDAVHNMGLATRQSMISVECGFCGHRGPEIPVPNGPSSEADRAAFDGWNAEPRSQTAPKHPQ